MTSAKISAVVGVEWGIVDSAHGSAEETLDAAVKLGADLVRRNWDGKVYATTRRVVFAEVLAVLGSDESVGDSGDDDSLLSRL